MIEYKEMFKIEALKSQASLTGVLKKLEHSVQIRHW